MIAGGRESDKVMSCPAIRPCYTVEMKQLLLVILFLVACQPADVLNHDDRIIPISIYTVDGTEVPRGWFDTQLDVSCTWWTSPGGETRCYPAILPTFLYSNEVCSKPVAVTYEQCAQDIPLFIGMLAVEQCGPSRHFYRGKELTQAEYYRRGDGQCQPVAAVYGARYFAAGAEVSSDTFALAD